MIFDDIQESFTILGNFELYFLSHFIISHFHFGTIQNFKAEFQDFEFNKFQTHNAKAMAKDKKSISQFPS
jgi:hypothetical protein